MVTFRKKRPYEDPRTIVTQADLEGLICTSVFFRVEVDELHNINTEVDAEGSTVENLYFEF